jgi:tetratricopeptide (TPR) repeat protein
MGGRTPGGHPLIRAAWLSSGILLVISIALGIASRGGRSAAVIAVIAALLFVLAYMAYLARHFLFLRVIARSEAALAAGDLELARDLLAPLLDAHADQPQVQRAAGIALYRLGDPLSAAQLLERAARSYAGDVEVATTLVAAYAALNRAGDARRASALAPTAVDVRLALAWSELVALGGDRAAGADIVRELGRRADVTGSTARQAMASSLAAIAAARGGDATAAQARLVEATAAASRLPAYERAFVGYLEGIALRELALTTEAAAAFERAMALAPGTIGEALARRERAGMAARLAAPSQTSAQG